MHPEPWQRSTLKPLSLLELSFQVRLIWLVDAVVVVRLPGGDGSAEGEGEGEGDGEGVGVGDGVAPAPIVNVSMSRFVRVMN